MPEVGYLKFPSLYFFAGGFGMMMVNKRIGVCICISLLLSAVATIIIGTKICAGGNG